MNEGKRDEDVNPESPRRHCWVNLPEELSMPTLAVTCSFIPEKLSTTLNLAAEAVVPKLTESVIEPLISVSSTIPLYPDENYTFFDKGSQGLF